MQLSQILKTFRVNSSLLAEFFCGIVAGAASYGPLTTLVYGPIIAINAALANSFVVTITDGVAFAIAAPTNMPPAGQGQRIAITFRNASGGAHGAGTFNAIFKMNTNTLATIANGQNRTYEFESNGTNWILVAVPGTDIPN